MSKRETPLTLRYWDSVGGALMLEFCAVTGTPHRGRRLLDAVIVLDEPKRCLSRDEHDPQQFINGKDIVVVQTKAARLGMSLLGQALFSKELMHEFFMPRSVRSVAVCTGDDAVLRPLAERHGIEIVCYAPG